MKVTKQSNSRKSKVPDEKVLLNCTSLNRKVMLSLDPSTFEAKILFHLQGRFPLATNYNGCIPVHEYQKKLKEETGETYRKTNLVY